MEMDRSRGLVPFIVSVRVTESQTCLLSHATLSRPGLLVQIWEVAKAESKKRDLPMAGWGLGPAVPASRTCFLFKKWER